jgi:hypothetical protein
MSVAQIERAQFERIEDFPQPEGRWHIIARAILMADQHGGRIAAIAVEQGGTVGIVGSSHGLGPFNKDRWSRIVRKLRKHGSASGR